ncbi:class I SAM-dependent methyltransferase [Deinococcus koreensis]|uniref:SAM-dependent methyltransferase n=1 Tax=Deinococcus koreensis TaxID=2054903 RepID=A0A2K3UU99_9DEIO|nr:class I SAM-dependent methyltransferase [Deinococcus koreensis]PNY80112.1 SAM-dependent methyltransferase [Deinococcus koreensis]
MGTQPLENWGASDANERYVGRWSRPVARRFLDWLALPDGGAWTDVGCGTGALSAGILTACTPSSVTGVDRSEGFIEAVRTQMTDPRAHFVVSDATDLPLADASSDVAVSGLVLNFVPDHAAMLREMMRVTRPGGTVAAYVWDYAEGMEMMRVFWDAVARVNPNDGALDERDRFPICRPEALTDLWRQHHLKDVAVHAIDIPTVFRDFSDYWTPFLGRQGPAPAYLASLDDDTRERVRAEVQARLVPAADGTIALAARAWAVRGTC